MKLDESFLQLFESVPAPAVLTDNDHIVLTANSQFFKAYRATPEEIKGIDCNSIHLRNRKGGKRKKFEEYVTSETAVEGGVVYFLKPASEAARRQKSKEHYLRVMAEHIPRSTFILFESDNRISVAEGKALQTFGCNREKLEGKRLDEILRPAKLAEFEEIMGNARKGEERTLIRTVKDSIFKIEFVPVKNDAGEVVSVLFISEDITLRRKADIEKSRVDKLELTQKILRNIAHEVRNPLTNINLSIDELKEQFGDRKEAEMYFDIILRNTSRINDLVSQIMQSTKPAALERKYVKIEDIAADVERESGDRVKLRNIEFKKRVTRKKTRLYADREKITVALLNIVINATEAVNRDEGKIGLSAWQNEDEVIFSVRDNGKGMSREEIEKIYDPFQTGKSSGMGLGLTGVLNIVNAHGGKIKVNSSPGEGTTFYLKFPLNGEPPSG